MITGMHFRYYMWLLRKRNALEAQEALSFLSISDGNRSITLSHRLKSSQSQLSDRSPQILSEWTLVTQERSGG
jgi:hypothetical protein